MADVMRDVFECGTRLLVAGALVVCVGVASVRAQPMEDTGEIEQVEGQVIHLSLLDAVETALKNNNDIMTERYNVMIAEADVVVAQADFDPYLQADSTFVHSEQPAGSQLLGAQVQETESVSWNGTLGARVITGANIQLAFENKREETNSSFSSLNPQYESSITLSASQPILRNGWWTVNRVRIRTAKNQRESSKLTLRKRVLQTMSDVEDAYWQLVSARDNLQVSEMSLDLAEELLALTEAQVRTGLQAPIATLQAESSVASREESRIVAENGVRTAENNLKLVMNFAPESVMWDVRIIPGDQPADVGAPDDTDGALDEAIANNIDLKQIALNRDTTKQTLRQSRNQLLHQLDINGSIGYAGLAGDPAPGRDEVVQTGRIIPDPSGTSLGLIETRVIPAQPSPFDGGYEDALQDILDTEYMTWTAGAQFQIPLGNRAARNEYRKAILNIKKTDISNAQTRNNINLLMRNLLGDLESNRRRVVAAEVAEELAKKTLDTEQRKYELGLTTETDVLQTQEDYAQAVTRATQARIDYNITRGKVARARAGYLPLTVSGASLGVAGSTGAAGGAAGATSAGSAPLPTGGAAQSGRPGGAGAAGAGGLGF